MCRHCVRVFVGRCLSLEKMVAQNASTWRKKLVRLFYEAVEASNREG